MTDRLGTDCWEYELLNLAIQLAPKAGLMTCEIGVRAGGSSQIILEELAKVDPHCTHIAVDPYGQLPYAGADGHGLIGNDYTNLMRNHAMHWLYKIAEEQKVNFVFFNIDDEEFFKRFADGVPLYHQGFQKQIKSQYQMVFLDGPHTSDLIINEIDFFVPRLIVGGTIVLDDYDFYDYDKVDKAMTDRGMRMVVKGAQKKVIYQK